MIQSSQNIFDIFFLILTFIFLCLGSIGIFTELFLLLGTTNFITALGYKLLLKGKIEFPKNYTLYLVFLLTLLVHTYFSKGKFLFFWLFLSGGMLWLQVHNFKKVFSQYFTSILIILGFLMGILYFYSLYNPIILPNLVSLFAAPTSLVKHSNLGDLWAIVLIPILFLSTQKKSYLYLPLIIIGIYSLTVSYSRAALVSLTIGILYISQSLEIKKNIRKVIIAGLIGIGILFIYFGISKTILLSRPYFLQAITGIIQYPFGTGMGNFTYIGSTSNLVHNLVLEMFSGMGIFSVVFIVWLYKVLRSIFANKNINTKAAAVFLAVLTNFCFNTTYTIPAFVWIWFLALGLI